MSCQATVGGGGVVIGQSSAHPASVNPGNTQSGKVITMDNGYYLSRILGVVDARSQSQWPEVSSIQEALYRLQTDWRNGRCRYSARGGMSLILRFIQIDTRRDS